MCKPAALAVSASFVSAMLVLASGCLHEVDHPQHGDGAASFVAEGDDLLAQLQPDDVDGFQRTPLIPAATAFSRIGIRYDARGPVAVETRVTSDNGATFSDWRPAQLAFREDVANNAFSDVDGAAATHVQLRFLAPVESELSFLAVESFDKDLTAEDSSASSTTSQGLAADGIAVTRSEWGARARSCNTPQRPNRITIHQTETPNHDSLSMAARMRQIQSYHIDVRGFCDIGYHFVVGQDGNVYAGRREDNVGAHAGGANQDNVGIAFAGTFHDSAPSDAMMRAAARVMAGLASAYAIDLSRSTVKGHREVGTTSTDCPGDALFGELSSLIDAARGALPGGTGNPGDPGGSSDSAVYAGLTSGDAVIPHAGVANDTLANSLGVSVEPYGTVTTRSGHDFVQGKCSQFGGPNDTGVTISETGSVSGERLRSLNTPLNASASTIASRPQDFYFVAMRWDYTPVGRNFWKNARLLLVNPDNGKAVVVRPVDWGPNTSTHRIIDISPQAMKDLGTDTDHNLLVSFAQPTAALGVTTWDAPATSPPATSPPATNPPATNPPATNPPASASLVIPVGTPWQWQLTGTVDQSVDVPVYDVDLFDTPTSTIASLQGSGRTVICYFSAGTYESWRPDADALPASARGNALQAPFDNELWLDTRDVAVRSAMSARLDLAVSKGCDAVEPDNVDGYTNSPGFALTALTQLDFNRFLAGEAHARGLSVGLKNDVDQLSELEPSFDWALNEECVANQECDAYSWSFIAAGKAVLHAEYSSDVAGVCAVTRPLHLSTILKSQDLGAARTACP